MFSFINFFTNRRWIAVFIVGLFILVNGAQAQEKIPPKDKKEKTSYALGANLGRITKDFSMEIDANMVAAGVKDAQADKMLMSDEEIRTVLNDFNKEMQAKQNEKVRVLAEKNKKEGEAFLKENEKTKGVVKLPSGLQYKIIKEGTGKIPKATDTVSVHYKGTLINGMEFDSSYKRNQPAEFKVNAVIPGWTEILQKMKTGSKYNVYIPSNLAYGEKGRAPVIGPNAALIFEIELIAIK